VLLCEPLARWHPLKTENQTVRHCRHATRMLVSTLSRSSSRSLLHPLAPGRMKLALAGGRLYTLGWPGVLKSSISLFSSSPVWQLFHCMQWFYVADPLLAQKGPHTDRTRAREQRHVWVKGGPVDWDITCDPKPVFTVVVMACKRGTDITLTCRTTQRTAQRRRGACVPADAVTLCGPLHWYNRR